jgi:hypothetical protein
MRKPRADKGMTRAEYRAKQAEIQVPNTTGMSYLAINQMVERYPWYREKLKAERLLPR